MTFSREISCRRDPVIWGEYGDVAKVGIASALRAEGAGSRPVVSIRHTRAQAMQGTSLDALPQADVTHRLIEAQVLSLCDSHPCAPLTTFELAELIGKPVNCLTQPVKTLRERGLIVFAGLKTNPTGASAHSWITPHHAVELGHQVPKP